MSKFNISLKLPVMVVALSLLTAIVLGIIAYLQSESSLRQSAMNKLSAVQESRIHELNGYLQSIVDDVHLMSRNQMVIDALEAFEAGWEGLGGDPTARLQELYITGNPNPAGEKHRLDAAPDGSAYSATHARFHPYFRDYLEGRGYYDIFLVDVSGRIVYTVFKENDFATNLIDGRWKDSDIGRLVRDLAADFRSNRVAATDFAPYAPSNGAAASFIGAPVFDRDGGRIGFLVFQMPVGRINAIMQNQAGMGESGEAYIVGQDRLMRSDSRFSDDSTILKQRIDTEQVRAALNGETGALTGIDYRGVAVLAAFGPLEFQGLRWGVLSEIDAAEVDRPVVDMRNFLLLAVLGLAVVISALGIAFARTVTRPIDGMTRTMNVLASGDLAIEIPSRERGDEIGRMATAVQVFKENAIRVKEMEAEQAELKRQAEAQRKAAMLQMADTFERSVGKVVDTVTSAATELQAASSQMAATATETSSQATTVAGASEQASTNVETVAASAEQLTASINDIAQQVARSSQVAVQADDEASTTTRSVRELSDNVQKIGEIVDLINDIAEQTNLLALNATIEAARAGDAGKGFAVVASEVKNLANQTARATDEIGTQIGAVQAGTDDAVKAIESIAGIISEMSEISSTVASAVQEQTAATNEIARNVEQASQGTAEVSSSIATVQEGTQNTGAAATQIQTSAGDLSRQAEILRAEVARFLAEVRDDSAA